MEIGGENLSDQNKVVKFKKRRSINIGVVIFLMLFLYIAINVAIYITKDKLSIYEVHEGNTAIDNRITALLLRQEKLVGTNKAGYVVYYLKDGARIAKDSSVYAITDDEIYYTDNSDEVINLTKKDDVEIKREINSFKNSYSDDNFASVYTFKENIQSTVLDILNSSLISSTDDETASSKSKVPSKESGIITYYMDSYEDVKADDVTADMFTVDKYQKTNLRTTEMITQNTPVYKIITSEEWNMVLKLTKTQYKKLEKKERVSFTILKNDYDMTASLRLSKKGSQYFAILTMNKNLSSYLSDRFLEIEIEFDSVSGLKIPNTSITEKEFYEVPLEYFTKGGESKGNGLNKITYSDNETKFTYVPVDIYYQDENFAYIDTRLFPTPGTVIQIPKKSDQYTLSKTIKLTGVYNVNQGYAVFKRIEILNRSEDYCIISKDTQNGLSAYDHIALEAKTAVEQKIIY